MSEAVEVLKEARKDIRSCLYFNQEDYYKGVSAHIRLDNALDEALLVFEKQEFLETELRLVRKQMLDYENKLNRLDKWLDERIKSSEKYPDTQEEAFYLRKVKEVLLKSADFNAPPSEVLQNEKQ